MDAFYASVEQNDHPELRGKPLAVGGGEKRGVVAAASYEARKFGIHSAMSGMAARRACPSLIFVTPRFDRYKEVSQQIRAIFYEYTDLVEPLSLDEAYLDVTSNKKSIVSATIVAKEIKAEVRKRTGLTASAGVSMNKFLAKVASDFQKPDGLTVIRPEEADAFIDRLKIDSFYGIGRVTAKKMHALGIHLGKDLKKWSKIDLVKIFGKAGALYYDIAWNKHESRVNPFRIRKSLGAERTFTYDVDGIFDMLEKVQKIAEEVHRRMQKNKVSGKTVTLKVKFADFHQITRSKTLNYSVKELWDLIQIGESLMKAVDLRGRRVRLLGLTVSHFDSEKTDTREKGEKQLSLGF